MQKECLEEREAEIYRTLLKSSNQFTDINESFAGCGGEYSSAAFCFTDPAPKKCNTPSHPFRKKRGMDGAQRFKTSGPDQ
jgi:hypothetical protein